MLQSGFVAHANGQVVQAAEESTGKHVVEAVIKSHVRLWYIQDQIP